MRKPPRSKRLTREDVFWLLVLAAVALASVVVENFKEGVW
jgi:hypothetical protein